MGVHATERNLEESPADMSDAQFGTDTDFRRPARVGIVLYLVLAIVCFRFSAQFASASIGDFQTPSVKRAGDGCSSLLARQSPKWSTGATAIRPPA